MNEKNDRFCLTAVVVAFLLGGAIGGIAVFGYLRSDRSIDRQSERAIGINREITDSLRGGLDRNSEAVDIVEKIRGRHQETDRVIGELGGINNGSGDLLQILRKKIEILENYFRDTGGIISGYGGSGGE
jgi:hypothetical protein